MYKISAVTRSGTMLTPVIVDTPAEALAKFRELRELHPSTWVNDDEGNDVSEGQLERCIALDTGL